MKTINEVLQAPISEWPQLLLSVSDTQGAESELTAMIQRAALLEAYLAHRYNTGCGDQGHNASAKHAGRVLVKIRKALGFSYPKNTPLRIA